MVRTFLALRAVPPGFTDPGHVQLARVIIPEGLIADPERVLRRQRDILDRLATIPGVTDVSFTGNVPMAGERNRSGIYREDLPMAEQSAPLVRWFRFVAPGFFQTIGTRLVAGRDFSWVDLESRRPVAVISENLARELWREPQAALGKRIREGDGSPWREVVGVVADVYDDGVHRRRRRLSIGRRSAETFYGRSRRVVERSPLPCEKSPRRKRELATKCVTRSERQGDYRSRVRLGDSAADRWRDIVRARC